jgi:hypothetical protein
VPLEVAPAIAPVPPGADRLALGPAGRQERPDVLAQEGPTEGAAVGQQFELYLDVPDQLPLGDVPVIAAIEVPRDGSDLGLGVTVDLDAAVE